MNKFKEIFKTIKKYNTIFIFGHKFTDQDCAGSQFGLKAILKEKFKNKNIYTVGEDNSYTNLFGKMDYSNISQSSGPICVTEYVSALGIVVDTSTADRINDIRFSSCDKIIKIDHHLASDNTNYGDINLVDSSAASCTQLIAKFAKVNKLKISDEAAKYLYVGLVTDSGNFKYNTVSTETMTIAAELLKHNIDLQEIDLLLHETTKEKVRFNGYLLSNSYYKKTGIAYAIISKDICTKYGLDTNTAIGYVNALRNIHGYPICVLAVEDNANYRVSIRSTGPAINEVATKFGGGGHALAAGCTAPSKEKITELIKDLENLIKN